jgi:hypothetical protein
LQSSGRITREPVIGPVEAKLSPGAISRNFSLKSYAALPFRAASLPLGIDKNAYQHRFEKLYVCLFPEDELYSSIITDLEKGWGDGYGTEENTGDKKTILWFWAFFLSIRLAGRLY